MPDQALRRDPDAVACARGLKRLRAMAAAKEAGNTAFRERRWGDAHAAYSQALQRRSANALAEGNAAFYAQCFSNRCAHTVMRTWGFVILVMAAACTTISSWPNDKDPTLTPAKGSAPKGQGCTHQLLSSSGCPLCRVARKDMSQPSVTCSASSAAVQIGRVHEDGAAAGRAGGR